MKYCLVGAGGCGMHFVKSAFADKISLASHTRQYEHAEFVGGKVLYLFADPYNVILSYYRRGFLGGPGAVRNVEGDIGGFTKRGAWGLDEFLANGVDFFHFREHYDGWLNYDERQYQIMFMKYEAIGEHKQELRDWLDVEDDRPIDFANRHSDWTRWGLSDRQHEWLRNMYGEYHQEWLDAEEVVVK